MNNGLMNSFQDKWYQENYSKVNASAAPGGIFFKVLHTSLELGRKTNYGLKIFEVGGHTGEHVPFVKDDWRGTGSYTSIDIRMIDEKEVDSVATTGVDFQQQDVSKMIFPNEYFDRVISTCLLHHVDNPLKTFEEIRRVTKVGGVVDIFLPNDPGATYRALRAITTLRVARRLDILEEAQLMHALEHRNHFLGIKQIAKKVFENDTLKVVGFPFVLDFYNLNAFSVFRICRK